MSDINASRRKEQICAEVVLEEALVSLKQPEYRAPDQWTKKFSQPETSDDRDRRQQRGSADVSSRKLWDGFDRLTPIPSSRRSRSRFGHEEREFFKQVTQD